ncbi:hypothetical protein Tco_1299704 [Tanacetum coccineum]
MEVRKVEESYGVNLIRKQWKCQFWEISGILFVHVVAGYMILTKCWGRGRGFRGRDGDIGVRGAYAGRGGSEFGAWIHGTYYVGGGRKKDGKREKDQLRKDEEALQQAMEEERLFQRQDEEKGKTITTMGVMGA